MSLSKASNTGEGKEHHCPICDKNWTCADDECGFSYESICTMCSTKGEKKSEYYGRIVIP